MTQTRLLSFDSYRAICDSGNPGARKLGILSETLYQEAAADQQTVLVELDGGAFPGVVPIRHGLGLGYDWARCERIAGEAGCASGSIWALPPGALSDRNLRRFSDRLAALNGALFFSHSEADMVTQEEITITLRAAGKKWTEHLLEDDQAQETTRQTTLTLWGMTATPKGVKASAAVRNEEVFDRYSRDARPAPSSRGSFLVMGHMLTHRQLEEMWQLYLDRFLWLGLQHPVSMEDSQDDWRELITSDGVLCSLFTENLAVVCFTYVLDSTEPLYWLNGEFLRHQGGGSTETLLFFPGIVASASNVGYSMPTISLMAESYARAGATCRVVFENTNRSEAYIPPLLERVLQRGGQYDVSRPAVLDKTTYRLLTLD